MSRLRRVAAVAAVLTIALSSAGLASIGGATFLEPVTPLRAETDVVPGWVSDVAFEAAGLCAVMMVVEEDEPGVSDIVDVTLGARETADLDGHSVACGSGEGSPRRFGAPLRNATLLKGDLSAPVDG